MTSALSLPAPAAALARLADARKRLGAAERRPLARAVLIASLAFWLVGVLLLELGLPWTTRLDTAAARPDGGHAYVLRFRPFLGVLKAAPDEPTRPGHSGLALFED